MRLSLRLMAERSGTQRSPGAIPGRSAPALHPDSNSDWTVYGAGRRADRKGEHRQQHAVGGGVLRLAGGVRCGVRTPAADAGGTRRARAGARRAAAGVRFHRTGAASDDQNVDRHRGQPRGARRAGIGDRRCRRRSESAGGKGRGRGPGVHFGRRGARAAPVDRRFHRDPRSRSDDAAPRHHRNPRRRHAERPSQPLSRGAGTRVFPSIGRTSTMSSASSM